MTATWSTVPGRTYTLQVSPDLSAGSWADVASGVVASGSTTSRVDPDSAGQPGRFYRAMVE